MIDRRYFRYFDWISFSLILTLVTLGLTFVWSVTSKDTALFSSFFKKQIFGIGTGIIIYFFFSFFDFQTLCRWGYFGYFGILGMLAYTITGGLVGMGAKRWISLYFFTFQPAELIKLLLPLFWAFYFHEQKHLNYHSIIKPSIKEFIFPIIILGISFLLVIKQPDLGTALIILFSGIILLWITHVPKSFFIISSLICILGAPILWNTLQPYQQRRLLVLAGYGDTKNERYQIEQSKIAIGSGGLWGKGIMKGTQNRLSFLPEARTDFIFSILCEEIGFAGALFVLLLFCLLFIRLTSIAIQISRPLEQIAAVGLLAPIMFATIINVGMVTGILPIVGIPLPLFTYGITHLWITFASLGIINNIAMHRFQR